MEKRVRHSEQGEVPDIGDDFGERITRWFIRNALNLARGQDDEHELGIRINGNGNSPGLYDGPASDLEYSRHDKGLFVKLKEAATKEARDHPLRDGAILTGATLLGATLYIRHKNKK